MEYLYNCLPLQLREFDGELSEFKLHLDRYLKKLPDQPEIPGLIPDAVDIYGKPSNCIIDWVIIINPPFNLKTKDDMFYNFDNMI